MILPRAFWPIAALGVMALLACGASPAPSNAVPPVVGPSAAGNGNPAAKQANAAQSVVPAVASPVSPTSAGVAGAPNTSAPVMASQSAAGSPVPAANSSGASAAISGSAGRLASGAAGTTATGAAGAAATAAAGSSSSAASSSSSASSASAGTGSAGSAASGAGVCEGATPHGCYVAAADNPMGCPPQIHEQSAYYPPTEEWEDCSSPWYTACNYTKPEGGTANCACDTGVHWLCMY